MKKSIAAALTDPYRITDGKHFRLKQIDPADTAKIVAKEQATGSSERAG